MCFNPCSIGSHSRSARKLCLIFWIVPVSIHVLSEVIQEALVVSPGFPLRSSLRFNPCSIGSHSRSIRTSVTSLYSPFDFALSFNPCSIGSHSRRAILSCSMRALIRFNPCSIGSHSRRFIHLKTFNMSCRRFNPCSIGSHSRRLPE